MGPTGDDRRADTIFGDLNDDALSMLGIIHKNGPLTITNLMEITQIPRTTLNRSVKELLDNGLIMQDGVETSTGGRPSAIFSVDPEGFYTVGVELSHANIHVLICDALLEPLWIADFAIVDKSTPEEIFTQVFAALERNLLAVVTQRRRLLGIGIGSVGPLDLRRGVLLNAAGFPSSNWNNLDLTSMFERRFLTPVYIQNGASAAAMAEYVSYAASEVHSLIFFNVGVSVRCGVISGDTLLTGDGDMEGAYGHLIIVPGGRPCYCGKFGCIESYATAPAISKSLKQELRKGKVSTALTGKSAEHLQFQDICDAAKSGDTLCVEMLRDAATHMGIVVANIVNILHPEVVVIGGTVPDRCPDYFTWTVQTAEKMVYNPGHKTCQFTTPKMGHDTIAAGAAAMVLLSAMKGRNPS